MFGKIAIKVSRRGFMKISIVIPVYNEVEYIKTLIGRVQSVPLENTTKEIVIIDDFSTDGTREFLLDLQRLQMESQHSPDPNVDTIKILFQEKNLGKGSALNRGFSLCTGDVVIIQDADLEYDPNEYPKLLQPIRNGFADVVYGSRFLGGPHRVLYYWHYLGNKFLTTVSNVFTNLNLSDMECCYKVISREVLEKIDIQQNRFGVEPELTAKLAKMNCSIYEIPISYFGRTYEEGKKIGWKDGINALYCILRYNLFS